MLPPICSRFCSATSRNFITDERLVTLRSLIFARLVRMSSCTPSAKNELSLSGLKFWNGNTARVLSGPCDVTADLQQVLLCDVAKLHHRRTAGDPEVFDLCQTGEDVI